VDWLSWSKPRTPASEKDALWESIIRTFSSSGEKATVLQSGYAGFDLAGYGSVLQRGTDLLVILPGQAMQFLRNAKGFSDVWLLNWFLSKGFRCTRIDTAIDTPDPEVRPQLAMRHWDAGAVTCTADSARPWEPTRKKGLPPPAGGWTFYIGSPASSRFMRIYDKAAEHSAKNGKTHLKHLTRFELQSRAEAADALARKIAREGLNAIRQVISGWIDFKKIDHHNKEKHKRGSADWWRRIVTDDKATLSLDPRIATPAKTLKWVKSAGVVRALALVRKFGLWDEIEREIASCEIPAHLNLKWSGYMHEKNRDAQTTLEPVPELFRNQRISLGHSDTGNTRAACTGTRGDKDRGHTGKTGRRLDISNRV
jgi:hypothetical protein